MASEALIADQNPPHDSGIKTNTAPVSGEAAFTKMAERVLLDRGVSSSRSVVESTDDGIMTPTLDDSQSEVSTPQPLPPLVTQAALSPQGDIISKTHNTTFTDSHIPNIEVFGAHLQHAIDAAWPIRAKPQYKAVHVLTLSWEDENPSSWADIQRLRYIFSNLYRFEVEDVRLRSTCPAEFVVSKVTRFIRENDDPSNLLIVYHAGHKLRRPDDFFRKETTGDILFLCDSCYSSRTIDQFSHSTTEVLAACGGEHQSPNIGSNSFTNALIRELETAFAGPAVSVTELHGRILNSLDKQKSELMRDTHGHLIKDDYGEPRYEVLAKKTPVYALLSARQPKRSILLSPLPVPNATLPNNVENEWDVWGFASKRSKRSKPKQPKTTSNLPQISTGPAIKYPRVLLSVRIERNYFPESEPDEDSVREWAVWLRDIPSGLESVVIEAVYTSSSSTSMILTLPLLVWHMLPSNAAYSFIGFVNSVNLQNVPSKASPAPAASPKEVHHRTAIAMSTDLDKREIEIESEVHRRVEAELVARELAALRKEKVQWERKLELEKEAALTRGIELGNSSSNVQRDHGEVDKTRAPIRFKDAVGRKFLFPFHLAATWNGVEELIKQAFLHVDILGPHVQQGHYDLTCSSGNISGQIILPQVWESLVAPGWEVNMHMWPMPEPPKPKQPPPSPPQSFSVRHRGPPPPAPKIYKEPPPPPPPGQAVPFSFPSSVRSREAHPLPLPPGVSIIENPKIKTSNSKPAVGTLPITDPSLERDEVIKTRSRRSSCSISEYGSGSEREYIAKDEAMALLKKLVTARRIFVVGRVGTWGTGRRGLIEIKVKPKGEGVQLLNEYGKRFVDKVRELKGDIGVDLAETSKDTDMVVDD